MSEKLNSFLSSYSREAREITLSLRALVLDVFSDAAEQFDLKSGIIAYSYVGNYKSIICVIAPHLKHVNLMFSRGTQLSDPSKLLDGKGKNARHVKIRSEAETGNPALRALLEETAKLSRKHPA